MLQDHWIRLEAWYYYRLIFEISFEINFHLGKKISMRTVETENTVSAEGGPRQVPKICSGPRYHKFLRTDLFVRLIT